MLLIYATPNLQLNKKKKTYPMCDSKKKTQNQKKFGPPQIEILSSQQQTPTQLPPKKKKN